MIGEARLLKIKKAEISFKQILWSIMSVVVLVPIIRSIFTGRLDYISLLCSVIGVGLGTPLTYYFMNGKSFKSMKMTEGIVVIVINIVVTMVIALGLFFLIVWIQNSF